MSEVFHFVKGISIWNFSGPYFLTLEPNTEIYREIFVFGLNAGKYGTEKLEIRKLLVQCLCYYYPKFSGIFYSD